MKDKPIIFNDPMVRAILEGRKTVTRRVVKPQPDPTKNIAGICPELKDESGLFQTWLRNSDGGVDEDFNAQQWKCPYGAPGDRLWVREMWADVNTYDGPAICYRADGSYMSWQDFSTSFGPDYGAGPSMDYKSYPGDYCMWWSDLLNGAPEHKWRPSIHMPRWASRITLDVTGVRVERLQDITEEDAKAEGLSFDGLAWFVPGNPDTGAPTARECFAQFWDSINAAPKPVYKNKQIVSYVSYPWEDIRETREHRGEPLEVYGNPWVWVISFKPPPPHERR
jgi:hypothetical protein